MYETRWFQVDFLFHFMSYSCSLSPSLENVEMFVLVDGGDNEEASNFLQTCLNHACFTIVVEENLNDEDFNRIKLDPFVFNHL